MMMIFLNIDNDINKKIIWLLFRFQKYDKNKNSECFRKQTIGPYFYKNINQPSPRY